MKLFGHVWTLILLIMLTGVSMTAQTDQARDAVNEQTAQIAEYANAVDHGTVDTSFIIRRLAEERSTSIDLEKSLDAKVSNLKQRLEWLGEPLEGESAAVTRQRKELSEELKVFESALLQTKRNMAEIARIENEISLSRQHSRLSRLFEYSGSPLAPVQLGEAWTAGVKVLPATFDDLVRWYQTGVERNGLLATVVVLLGAIFLAVVLTFMFRGWVDTRIFRHLPTTALSLNTSILLGLLKITIRVLPVFLGCIAIYQALSLLGLLDEGAERFARMVLIGLMAISLADAVGRTFLTPRDSRFQIAKVSTHKGGMLRGLVTLITIVLAIDLIIFAHLQSYPSTQALLVELNAVSTLVLCGLILALIRKSAWKVSQPESEAELYAVNQGWLKVLRNGVRVALILVACAVVLGYPKFAHFVVIRFCFTVATLFGLLAVRSLCKGALSWLLQQMQTRKGQNSGAVNDGDKEFLSLWLDLLVDGVMLVIAVPVFLVVMGLSWDELGLLGQRMLDGFTIGNQRFSLVQIVVGLLVFLLLMSMTRLFQRVADRRVLSRMRVDDGIRNSLKTLIGYVGLVIAFMTGVGMVGFDLSNLAIIAGALSVGIGFGLQSIVNNFVSGLILLFERPIKVGDWVVTNSGEGIVKKISVRSTEIETFDRSSIIVPNSELISSSVTNWTHKTKLGRVTVPVGVSYSEDPERILDILREVPKRVDVVLRQPEPLILFTGFGDSSLNFEIRAFIADISTGLSARTKIRLEIVKAFRDAEVEIPFPQRDLHLRTVSEGIFGGKRPPHVAE